MHFTSGYGYERRGEGAGSLVDWFEDDTGLDGTSSRMLIRFPAESVFLRLIFLRKWPRFSPSS